MDLSRRLFLRCAVAGMVGLPGSTLAQPIARFRPEDFGAIGDGAADDYDAFARLVLAVNAAGRGIVALRPGRTYYLGRHIYPGSRAEDLVFIGCDGLTIEGNGAQIRVKGDFRRDSASVRSLAGLSFRDCRRIVLTRLELAGGVEQTRRSPGLTEAPSHGLSFQSCSDVTLDGLIVRHFAADGLYIRESARPGRNGMRQASRSFKVRNSRFLFNARQGLSIIQLRGGLFENCDFSYTGYVDSNGRVGPYGAHSPGAGVDVEPNRNPGDANPVDVLTGDIVLRGCRLAGNFGATLVAAKYAGGSRFIEQVTIESSQLECNDGAEAGQDGFIFDVPGGIVRNCTLRMRDKTAYLGWYPTSDSDPSFSSNVVYGRNSGRNRPMFTVRPTRGSPLIEGNRFIGEQRRPKDPRGAWLVYIDHPKAIVRRNFIFVPAEIVPPHADSSSVPIVFARAAVMDGNTYETDLAAGTASFSITYAGRTRTRNETYRGRSASRRGAIGPARREGS